MLGPGLFRPFSNSVEIEFATPGAHPPGPPGAPPRGWGRGIEASNPRGPGDFFSETPGDAGAILLHKFEDFWLFGSRILQILNEILDIIQFSESYKLHFP